MQTASYYSFVRLSNFHLANDNIAASVGIENSGGIDGSHNHVARLAQLGADQRASGIVAATTSGHKPTVLDDCEVEVDFPDAMSRGENEAAIKRGMADVTVFFIVLLQAEVVILQNGLKPLNKVERVVEIGEKRLALCVNDIGSAETARASQGPLAVIRDNPLAGCSGEIKSAIATSDLGVRTERGALAGNVDRNNGCHSLPPL